MRRAPSERAKAREEEEEAQRQRRNLRAPPSERKFARKRRCSEVNELWRLRRSERYGACIDEMYLVN